MPRILATSRIGSSNRGGVPNYSLDFTTSQYVTFGSIAFQTAGTIAFWVKYSSTAGDNYIFDSSASARYLLYLNASLKWGVYLNGVEIGDLSNGVERDWIDNDTWTHVVITWDNALSTDKQKFYKNGVLHSTKNVTVSTAGTPTNFYWNQRYTANARSAEKLDRFLICNQALSASEINSLYLSDTIPGSAIHYWSVNEGTGTAIADSVGSRNGTITGATWSTDVGTPTAFTPSNISGLKFWLNAGALVLNNDDPVASWTDSSSTGNTVTEATNRPLYKTGGLNGKPYVYFNGTNNALTKTSPVNLPTGTSARSVFIVAQDRSIANYHPMVAYGSSNNNEVFSLAFHSTTALLSWGYNNDDVISTTLANNTGYYFTHQYTGTNIVVRQNGVEKSNYADTIATTSSTLKIGNYVNDAYPAPINIYEVLIYDSYITGVNLVNIENYLAIKYGL